MLRGWTAYDLAPLASEAHAKAERLGAAIGHADRALAIEPQHAGALHLRGRSRFQLWVQNLTTDPAARARLLDLAQADLDSATKADPALASAWIALSSVYHEKKDNISAAIYAERAYEADAFLENQDDNLQGLFQTHYDLEQFPMAQRWCDEGARRFRNNRNIPRRIDRFRWAVCHQTRRQGLRASRCRQPRHAFRHRRPSRRR